MPVFHCSCSLDLGRQNILLVCVRSAISRSHPTAVPCSLILTWQTNFLHLWKHPYLVTQLMGGEVKSSPKEIMGYWMGIMWVLPTEGLSLLHGKSTHLHCPWYVPKKHRSKLSCLIPLSLTLCDSSSSFHRGHSGARWRIWCYDLLGCLVRASANNHINCKILQLSIDLLSFCWKAWQNETGTWHSEQHWLQLYCILLSRGISHFHKTTSLNPVVPAAQQSCALSGDTPSSVTAAHDMIMATYPSSVPLQPCEVLCL